MRRKEGAGTLSKIINPELREAVEEIKRTVDPRQYADPVNSNARRVTYVCPVCGSGTGPHKTGMQYKPKQNVLLCGNCNKPYDAIELYQLRSGLSWGAAVHELSSGTSIKRINRTSSLSAKQPKPAKDYTKYYAECRPRITDQRAVKYLQGRGISVETATTFGWGFDPAADPAETGKFFCPRLIMPSGKGHYVGRRVDGVAEYEKMNAKDSEAGVTNLQELDKPGQVFVCEGAFSAASIYEAGGGLPVILNSADNAGKFIKHVMEHRPQALILLALDDDSKGRKVADDIAKALAEMKIPYRVTHGLADGDKDSNDLWIENPGQFRKQVQKAMEPETRQQENPFDGFMQRITDGRHKAVKTGIKELDELMGGGFVPGKLTLIGAAPGKAKTAVCQWIAETMAEHNRDLTALFLSLEMDRDELLARSLSRMMKEKDIADMSAFEILQGQNTEAIQQGIDKYLSLIGNRVQYNPGVAAEMSHSRNLQDILGTVEKAGRVDLLVVDYIQLMKSGGQSEMENIGNSMEALLDLAKAKNCIVLAVMANNRESNRAGSDSLFTGRGSSDLEYSANFVLNITDEEINDVPTGKRCLTLAKGRLAEVGKKLTFKFDGRHMRPHDLDLPLWGREATKKEAKAIEDISGLKIDRSAIKKK